MTRYRRLLVPGGTYFFTLVAAERRPIFADAGAVDRLREALREVMARRPFVLDAMVVLPDHLHAIWRLPPGDASYAERWRLIKYRFSLGQPGGTARDSLARRQELGIWQRRYWEHLIRNADDYARHCDYVHYNPVHHALVSAPADWPYSSFRAFVARGVYPPDWGACGPPAGIARVAGE
jgi:putative transposase